MQFVKKHKFLLLLILAGILLRFYNLNWGSPFYFHPDERNIVDLALRSSLTHPESLLKGTFAYGNFPIILALLLKPLFLPFFQLFNILDPFAQTVIVVRSLSASFSVLTMLMIYLCGKLWSQKVANVALFLTVFSTGFIQQAHFGTYDGFAAFLRSKCIIFPALFYKIQENFIFFYLAIFFVASGAAAKINFLVLAIFPFSLLMIRLKKEKLTILHVIMHAIFGLMLLVSLTAVLSPNYLTTDFRNALVYERGLVTGATPVFYTQSFYNTTPALFQFLHILPFLINPLLTILFIPAFFYLFFKGIKTKNISLLILTSYFLLLFLPQAFLHAKWTRYMVPTLPFIYLIIAIAISSFLKFPKKVFSIWYLVFSSFLTVNILFGASYFVTAFLKPDTRIVASEFARFNIPSNSKVLTEPYDLGITPFNISHIEFFNFYDYDLEASAMNEELEAKIKKSEYIILPSQRLLRSRLLNPKKFPKGHGFYSLLTNEALGFQKIYGTPCNLLCKLAYLNNPVFSFEETATVFERPAVFIFKKIR